MSKIRIDVYMVEKGLAPSRTKAQDLIKAGLVSVKINAAPRSVKSANELVEEDSLPEIIIQKSSLDKYVSRAGLKMEGALQHLNLKVEGRQVLDVGISTGGFTDCLLQNGAAHVVGVDVGHNQLNSKLKSDPRVQAFEGVNAREIHLHPEILRCKPSSGFDLVVIDVSFISLQLVLPSILKLLHRPGGQCLALVKPQFEVGPQGLNKNGIVKDPKLFNDVQVRMEEAIDSFDGKKLKYFESCLEGKDGNKEFFVFFEV